jgi:hypothetical protein
MSSRSQLGLTYVFRIMSSVCRECGLAWLFVGWLHIMRPILDLFVVPTDYHCGPLHLLSRPLHGQAIVAVIQRPDVLPGAAAQGVEPLFRPWLDMVQAMGGHHVSMGVPCG